MATDLGQVQDPTTIAVVQRWEDLTPTWDRFTKMKTMRYDLRHLERIPLETLDQALRVARAFDEDGGRPARPLDIARALKVQPTSGPFKTLRGAAIAYGLTEGGYNATQVSLTALGRRIVKPTIDGDDAVARREAMLRPRVVREFLQRYDGSKLPREDIGRNVLETMGVPKQAAARALNAIVEGAQGAGFLKDINGVSYVDLQNTDQPQTGGAEAPEPKLDAPDPAMPPRARMIIVHEPYDILMTVMIFLRFLNSSSRAAHPFQRAKPDVAHALR